MRVLKLYGESEFYLEVNVLSSFLEMTYLLATAQKRMYLWNASSYMYNNDASLVLKEIYCTLTWYRKQEIDCQREIVPFLRSFILALNFHVDYECIHIKMHGRLLKC